MSHVLLLDEGDELESQTLAQQPVQGDWKAKMSSFARRAGDFATETAKVAVNKTNSAVEAKVAEYQQQQQAQNQEQEPQLVIGAPTSVRKVGVNYGDYASTGTGTTNGPLKSDTPPPLPKKSPSATSLKKAPLKASGSSDRIYSGGPPSPKAPIRSSSGSVTSQFTAVSSTNPFATAEAPTSSQQQLSPRHAIFGASLKIATSDWTGQQVHKIPPIISDCVGEIKKRGLKEEGIFRVGGAHAVMQNYKAQYDQSKPIDLSIEKDINNISGLLKMYIRELPENLFTDQLVPVFQQAVTDPTQGPQLLADMLPLLPETNLLIIKEIFNLLTLIVQHSNVNMMTASNLAIIFTQVLKINGNLFHCLLQNTEIINKASAAPTQSSTEKDLILW